MRRRLVAVFAAVTTMVAIAFVVPLAVLVRDVARERALDDANRDASALFPILAVTDDAATLELAVSRTRAGSDGRLDVHLADGTVVGSARPVSPLVDDALQEGRASTGDVAGGAEVIAPVLRSDGEIAVVRVFVADEELTDGVRTAWFALVGVGLALVVGSVLLADRLARSVTRPVTALAAASHRLGDGDLSVRVHPAGPPEVADVGEAFNRLAAQVDVLLHTAREDVADLAHRLRTPLAALRLQIDQVDDPVLRGNLAASADELGRALGHVIEDARRATRSAAGARCDLREVLRGRAEFWGALAEDQGRAATVELPAHAVPVAVDATELAAAIDVVLENVFAHTAEGTAYAVTLVLRDGAAHVTIEDAGTGLPDADVLDRGDSRAASTGLGLDIARRTAERAGGRLVLAGVGGRGARVELVLPTISG